MKQYHDLVKHVLENGTRKENRTGVDTWSTFGYYYEHDLRDGFPLLTTKKIDWKNIVVELLWFLSGSNKAEFLERHKCRFWSPWTDEHGTVSNCYGPAWVKYPATRRLVDVGTPTSTGMDYVKPQFPLEAEETSDFCGEVRVSKKYGTLRVIRPAGRDGEGRPLFDAQFLQTGWVAKAIRKDVLELGELRDPYAPTVFGVGYYGETHLEVVNEPLRKNLRKVWQHMIERCYDPDCKEYQHYGLKGVEVCKKWHNFSEFLRDCQTLPNWADKRDNPRKYALDKDFYSSKMYSPSTCVWLPHEDNRLYAYSRPLEVTFHNGEKVIAEHSRHAGHLTGLRKSRILHTLQNGGEYKGFTFRWVDKKLRYPLPNNQIRWVTEELKRNSMSRRMVVSAWDPGVAQTAKLPPCHAMFVLNVQNEEVEEADLDTRSVYHYTKQRLNLHLTQRSADLALGIPYNLASYSLLLSLFSRFSGIEPGTFGHSLIDAHIYTSKPDGSMSEYDHVPGLMEQIKREPRALPKLVISDKIQTLDDVEALLDPSVSTGEIMGLFMLEGYDPYPEIKFRVAV